jgi:hypothetical protein
VSKLSDIVSEDILYQAIFQVVESQGQGGRSPRSDDNNGKLYALTESFRNQIFDFVLILFFFFFTKI